MLRRSQALFSNLVVAVLLRSIAVFAADAPELKSITVSVTQEKPRIDGVLDEAFWLSATSIRDLTQWSPGNGDAATEPTEVLFARDADNLYVAARFRDSDPAQIKAQQLVQGLAVFNDDYFQILLDPYNTNRSGYIFYVNPNGVQRDGLSLGGLAFNMDWDGIWEADAKIGSDGWTAEIAFPFKTLAFDPNNDIWRINVLRSIRRKREELAWSHKDRRITLDVAGELRGMRGARQGRGLDIVPSLALSQRDRIQANDSSFKSNPSLDTFWRITPSLTAALTLNTDFSSTEVDDRQVNLTRFSLFFPEKRDFFLDNSEVFEFGGLSQNARPFFSRTIGLSSTGQPIDLDVGAKLAGRVGRYSIGALAVRQAEFGGVDTQDLFVGRGYVSLGAQSTLGAIFTSGDPTSGRDNRVVGLDFNWRDRLGARQEIFDIKGWWQQSNTPDLEGDDGAWGFSLAWPNDRLNARLGVSEVERNFRPALGFVNRANVRQYEAEAEYRYRFARGNRWFRSWLGGVELRQFDSLEAELGSGLESRALIVRPITLDTSPGDQLSGEVARYTEVLSRPFLLPGGLQVRPGRYEFDRVRLYSTMAGFRPVAVNLDFESGDFYDGKRFDTRIGVQLRPNKHMFFNAQYQTNRLRMPAGSFLTRNYSLTANAAFNVNWAWLNVLQYDNVSRRLGLNSRLRWLPTQGQAVYLVVNYDWREDLVGNFQPFLAETTLKINYTLRF